MDTELQRIAVVGSGSWATALVKVFSGNGCQVDWYVREPEIRESVTKYGRNCLYLSDIELDDTNIRIYDNVNEALQTASVVVMVVPAAFLKVTTDLISVDLKTKYIFSAIKGIVPSENVTVTQYLNQHYGIPTNQLGVISGPTHAEEVALGRLSYLTVALKSAEARQKMCRSLSCHYVRTIESEDVHGIEYAGVLKNIIALCTGIAHGLGYGDNFTAVLVSNGLQELDRFISQAQPEERNTALSAYMGDLLVTCYSQFSRNRTFGTMIGKGYSVTSAKLEMNMIAEGYYAAECMHAINAQYGIDMPISNAVYNILYEHIAPAIELRLLSERLK